MEYRRRSLVKSISWRVIAAIVTFMFVQSVTGEYIMSTTITIVLNAAKTVFFYIHERLWDRMGWGRKM